MKTPTQPVATELQRMEFDKIQKSARLAVEDHWRNFFTLMRIDKQKAVEAFQGLDAAINMLAERMPKPDASFFRQTFEVERKKILDEYESNPDALKARLGLNNRVDLSTRTQSRQDLGELAVRTAVRATVWESIRSMFRLMR